MVSIFVVTIIKYQTGFSMSEWINVNDRLPEEYDWVLVSVVDWKNSKLRFIPHVAELRKGKWASQDDVEGDLET